MQRVRARVVVVVVALVLIVVTRRLTKVKSPSMGVHINQPGKGTQDGQDIFVPEVSRKFHSQRMQPTRGSHL